MRKSLRALFSGLLLLALPLPGFAGEPVFRTYLTATAENDVPLGEDQRYFDCSDTIYAVIEANGMRPGEHRLEAVWKDPDDRKVETTRHLFQSADGNARVWGWLRLHGPGGLAGAVGRAFDPSLGMEAFIGEWTVRVSVDGKTIAVLKFEILC